MIINFNEGFMKICGYMDFNENRKRENFSLFYYIDYILFTVSECFPEEGIKMMDVLSLLTF